jgi:large subunit ribosomal protein L31
MSKLTRLFENPHLRPFTQFSSTDLSTGSVDNIGVDFRACPGALRRLYYAPFLARRCRGELQMKAEIHPNYSDIKVTCSCGNEFTTRSTLGDDLSIEVCSSCHPFYTGKQKIVDSGGRVDKFRRKYGISK